jgi:hypothetical protein
MRILFTSTRGSHGKAVQLLSAQLDACADRDGFVRVDAPEEAEAIVFCEDYDPSELIWAKSVRAHPWIKKYSEICYTINAEDQPIGFLPGVYCSLIRRDYDPRRHRTWQYPRTANSLVAEVDPRHLFATVPQHLASFAGAAGQPVRQRLFRSHRIASSGRFALRQTSRSQFNSDSASSEVQRAREDYVTFIQNGKFSLCPRGYGANTYRIQESMALGRAPVILSDDWVPPGRIAWNSCAIFVPERHVERLPEILAERENEWETLGRAARAVWEAHFRPDRFALRSLQLIRVLAQDRSHDECLEVSRWPELERRRARRMQGFGFRQVRGRLWRRVTALTRLSRPAA